MLCTRRLLQRSVNDEGGGRRRTTTPSRAALQVSPPARFLLIAGDTVCPTRR